MDFFSILSKFLENFNEILEQISVVAKNILNIHVIFSSLVSKIKVTELWRPPKVIKTDSADKKQKPPNIWKRFLHWLLNKQQ